MVGLVATRHSERRKSGAGAWSARAHDEVVETPFEDLACLPGKDVPYHRIRYIVRRAAAGADEGAAATAAPAETTVWRHTPAPGGNGSPLADSTNAPLVAHSPAAAKCASPGAPPPAGARSPAEEAAQQPRVSAFDLLPAYLWAEVLVRCGAREACSAAAACAAMRAAADSDALWLSLHARTFGGRPARKFVGPRAECVQSVAQVAPWEDCLLYERHAPRARAAGARAVGPSEGARSFWWDVQGGAAVSGEGKRVRLWEPTSGRRVATSALRTRTTCVHARGGRCVAGDQGGTIYLLDAEENSFAPVPCGGAGVDGAVTAVLLPSRDPTAAYLGAGMDGVVKVMLGQSVVSEIDASVRAHVGGAFAPAAPERGATCLAAPLHARGQVYASVAGGGVCAIDLDRCSRTWSAVDARSHGAGSCAHLPDADQGARAADAFAPVRHVSAACNGSVIAVARAGGVSLWDTRVDARSGAPCAAVAVPRARPGARAGADAFMTPATVQLDDWKLLASGGERGGVRVYDIRAVGGPPRERAGAHKLGGSVDVDAFSLEMDGLLDLSRGTGEGPCARAPTQVQACDPACLGVLGPGVDVSVLHASGSDVIAGAEDFSLMRWELGVSHVSALARGGGLGGSGGGGARGDSFCSLRALSGRAERKSSDKPGTKKVRHRYPKRQEGFRGFN